MRWLTITILVLACSAGCPARGPEPVRIQPQIVTTIAPLTLILRELAGDAIAVETLLPPGADAHTFELKPSHARRVAGAELFFWVDPELDAWAVELDCRRKVCAMDLLPAEYVRQAAGHPHGHGEEGVSHGTPRRDPHFWTDPMAVKALLPALTDVLVKTWPGHRDVLEQNSAAFAAMLDALHAEATSTLMNAKAPLVQFHPSFGYLIGRYGLVDGGVVEEFPGREPTPRELHSLTERLRSAEVTAVFSEELLPPEPAVLLGDALGVPVITLDPACGAPETAYDGYDDWFRHNLKLIAEGLAK